MNSKKVTVYVNDKSGIPAQLTLLPEVADSFGWTDGQHVAPEEAAKARFWNVVQALASTFDDVSEAKRSNKKRGGE